MSGHLVLLAEDDKAVRESTAALLTTFGCVVTAAVDGQAALDLLSAGADADLLMTDIEMPRMDGWTLAERARELRPDLPVLYVTGRPHPGDRRVPGGAALPKPYGHAELHAAIIRLLGTARAGGG